MRSGKLFLGVLAGLAAGAVLGVLFAPEKGSNTRKRISRKTEDLMDSVNEKIEEKFEEVMDTVTGKLKKVKKEGSSAKAEIID
ncbi:YtxH domain-containing protein [Chryseolinea sp. H1M3-3]|uniref:YtxH domain-containing protein n=1 Tax=Chryseolinea sp. H1M3-3 TaxID=3034144 RepID=UPI0023EC268D|nr:YtxH domain-containing protein [Chryseolinea sp. H1M3-3]